MVPSIVVALTRVVAIGQQKQDKKLKQQRKRPQQKKRTITTTATTTATETATDTSVELYHDAVVQLNYIERRVRS